MDHPLLILIDINNKTSSSILNHIFIFTDDDVESYDSDSDIDDEEAEVYFLIIIFF